MTRIYFTSTITLCCTETEPTSHCKDMPEFKFGKVIEKRYACVLNLIYLVPLIMSPGQDCNSR